MNRSAFERELNRLLDDSSFKTDEAVKLIWKRMRLSMEDKNALDAIATDIARRLNDIETFAKLKDMKAEGEE